MGWHPMKMTGLLLVNLGSPSAPTTEALKRHLKQFLMDPDVIDIPGVLRWPLVHWLIVPRRARESALLYQKIWAARGSPLIQNSRLFANSLEAELEDYEGLKIELGMRYGEPSIRQALENLPLGQLDRLIVFPLYPQYAQSSTLTARTQVLADLEYLGYSELPLDWIEPFYNDTRYIHAVKAASTETLEAFQPDFSLFSFHGLPERHLKRLHTSCFSTEHCCEEINNNNQYCYRAQCVRTAHDVGEALGIPADRYSISFQSRLGRTPWIQPYTDFVIQGLPAKGVKRLAVFCPSFVADCLETLDEIENRETDRFLQAGGEELRLIPSLNDHPAWVRAAGEMIRDLQR